MAGCACEWIVVSKNRHMYCNDHLLQANALYAEYKAVNAVAVATFADDALDQAIALREEYARKFLNYEDTGGAPGVHQHPPARAINRDGLSARGLQSVDDGERLFFGFR